MCYNTDNYLKGHSKKSRISGVPKVILLVEDSKNIRDIVTFMLRNRGYEIVQAEDGQQGYDQAVKLKPDLIVLDCMLPLKTGFEICADLKSKPEYKQIPIVILTAVTQGSDKPDQYWKEMSKADDFISKPFKARDLIERIEKLINPPSVNFS